MTARNPHRRPRASLPGEPEATEGSDNLHQISFGGAKLRWSRPPTGGYLFDNLFRVVLGTMVSWLPGAFLANWFWPWGDGIFVITLASAIVVVGFLVGAYWALARRLRNERRIVGWMFVLGLGLGLVDGALAAILS